MKIRCCIKKLLISKIKSFLPKRHMKKEFEQEKNDLVCKVKDLEHKFEKVQKENLRKIQCLKCELRVQDKLIDRFKGYANVLKRELAIAKNIIKNPRNKQLR
ncbi:unnamed protein product [Moneuplotes crassus]|uniref:Uncharacterized protein n=1 Tax=Euplotes crassus TaxID=5936 RepID=A0AAD1XWL0_EUPCR|nr:unnamed protein product [Moneuplotes crassus]